MGIESIVRGILSDKGMTIRELSKGIEGSNERNIQQKIARGNGIRINKLVEILEGLDCELVIRDKETGQEYKVG